MPAILKCIEAGVTGPNGYKVEAEEFGKLAMTNEAKSMIKTLFFGMTSLKKNRYGNDYPPVSAPKTILIPFVLILRTCYFYAFIKFR